MEYTLDCFRTIISRYGLTAVKKMTGNFGFKINLENDTDFMHINYGRHPHDYPFHFSVSYCRQKYLNKNSALYETDTKQIIPLWAYEKTINTKITGSYEKDTAVICECCNKASEMYAKFQAMTDDEYEAAAASVTAAGPGRR
jgi:hypothetical protein